MKTSTIEIKIELNSLKEIKRVLTMPDCAEAVALACHAWNMGYDRECEELRDKVINFYSSVKLAVDMLDDLIKTAHRSETPPANPLSLS